MVVARTDPFFTCKQDVGLTDCLFYDLIFVSALEMRQQWPNWITPPWKGIERLFDAHSVKVRFK